MFSQLLSHTNTHKICATFLHETTIMIYKISLIKTTVIWSKYCGFCKTNITQFYCFLISFCADSDEMSVDWNVSTSHNDLKSEHSSFECMSGKNTVTSYSNTNSRVNKLDHKYKLYTFRFFFSDVIFVEETFISYF